MGRNLGPLNIKDTYEGLVQITSGSIITDGSGSDITYLNITASSADQAGTSGYAVSALSASFATTASFALNAGASTLQEVLDNNNTATQNIILDGYVSASNGYFTTPTTGLGSNALSFTKGAGLTTNIFDGGNGVIRFTEGDLRTDFLVYDVNIQTDLTASAIQTDNLTATSASIGYLQTVTGSAVIIGDAFVVVNSSPTSRYAGIKVYESGAAVPTTASLQFDSQTNDWFYEYTGSDPTNFGAVMFGPEYSTKGLPTYPTANTILKGNGGHHVIDSSITDDGTDIVATANLTVSGSTEVSGSVTINKKGTASTQDAFVMNGGVFKLNTDSYNNAVVVNIGQNNSVAGGSPTIGNLYFVGGNNNTMNSTTYGFLWGENNTINSTSYNGVILGTFGGTLTGDYSSIIGGQSNTVNGGFSTIIGGEASQVNSSYCGVFAGANNNVTNTGNTTVILGGYVNTAGANNTAILAGQSNTVNNGADYSGIILGYSNTVATNHTASVVVGGTGLTTTKNEEVVVPSLSVYGDTYISSSTLGTGSLIDNLGQEGVGTTTAVEHIVYCTQTEYNALTPDANTLYVISGSEVLGDTVVSGSLIGEVNAISVASSTGSLDCSVGNYFTLGLANAADTRLEASNIQIGQTINIKITNNATAAGTISFGPEFEFEGGTAFTATAATSAVDIITLVSFDGTSLQTVGVKNFS